MSVNMSLLNAHIYFPKVQNLYSSVLVNLIRAELLWTKCHVLS
jgi:hypothetical protein